LTVTYDRTMIALVKEIRRQVESDIKPSIKLANPDLLYELRNIYDSNDNAVLIALIKELYFKAGPEWMIQLKTPPVEELETKPDLTLKVYRGLQQLVESAPKESSNDQKKSNNSVKNVKMYRGHPVVE